ncbi:hypothetical protein HKX48_005701, partial [Thoreauomyces humboldtii]
MAAPNYNTAPDTTEDLLLFLDRFFAKSVVSAVNETLDVLAPAGQALVYSRGQIALDILDDVSTSYLAQRASFSAVSTGGEDGGWNVVGNGGRTQPLKPSSRVRVRIRRTRTGQRNGGAQEAEVGEGEQAGDHG